HILNTQPVIFRLFVQTSLVRFLLLADGFGKRLSFVIQPLLQLRLQFVLLLFVCLFCFLVLFSVTKLLLAHCHCIQARGCVSQSLSMFRGSFFTIALVILFHLSQSLTGILTHLGYALCTLGLSLSNIARQVCLPLNALPGRVLGYVQNCLCMSALGCGALAAK